MDTGFVLHRIDGKLLLQITFSTFRIILLTRLRVVSCTIQRFMAYCLRFVKRAPNGPDHSNGPITSFELHNVLMPLVKIIQLFTNELKHFHNTHRLSKYLRSFLRSSIVTKFFGLVGG